MKNEIQYTRTISFIKSKWLNESEEIIASCVRTIPNPMQVKHNEIIMAAEEEFGIEIPDEDAHKDFRTYLSIRR